MPMLSPNLSASAVTFAQELRVAFQMSSSLSGLSGSIGSNGVFQSSDGTAKDPLYVVRDGEAIHKFWRTPKDVKRIARYQRADTLWLDGGSFLKSEWHRDREYTDREHQNQYQSYNIPPLISAALTDLTCGGGCSIKTGIPSMDKLLNEDMKLSTAIYNWLLEASIYGFIGVQVNADTRSGELKLNRILPHHLYLQFASNHDPEPLCISKRIFLQRESIAEWQDIPEEAVIWGEAPTKNGCTGFVYEERHFKGLVENYLWIVNEDEIVGRLPMKYFDPDMPEVILTGLLDFAITIIPNEQRMCEYKGDWDEIININQDFNDRASRVSELLNKYEAPNLMVGENQATLDPVSGKTYYRNPRQGVMLVRPQDKFEPKYLQPGVETSGSENNLDFLLRMISMLTQVSPALIDPTKMEGIESGVAYKMKLTPTLAKINRRKVNQQEAIRMLVFNILGAINTYYEQNLVSSHLAHTAEQKVADSLTTKAIKCKDAMDRLGESGARISLDSFDELFANLNVLNNQPRGIFLQDPAMAQTPEELEWLADQQMLDFLASKEMEIQELLKLNEIDVEFTPSLPQDKAQAIERLGGKPSMSMERFLKEFDDMSDSQVQDEIRKIQDEEETLMSEQLASGLGGAVAFGDAERAISEETNLQSDKITAGTMPTSVNTADTLPIA